MEALEKIQLSCQQKRDNLANDLDLVKEQKQEAVNELLRIFPPKPDKEEDPSLAYQSLVTDVADMSIDNHTPKKTQTIPNAAQRKKLVKKAMKSEESCSCGAEEEGNQKVGEAQIEVNEGQAEVKDNKKESEDVKKADRPDRLNTKIEGSPKKSRLPSWRPPTPSGGAQNRKTTSSPSGGGSPASSPASGHVPRSNSRTKLVLKPRVSPQNAGKKTLERKGSLERRGSVERK